MAQATESKGAGSFARRDHLNDIESKVRDIWTKKGVFNHSVVPADFNGEDKEKFFCTFPYPYMNGKLHLGHAFTLTKAEFQARFQKLQGKNVLWPFAFHCTGMPIAAAANNLKREFREAAEEQEAAAAAAAATAAAASGDATDKIGVYSGKKTKLKAKTGNLTQAEILEKSGVPAEIIPNFQDPTYWLTYFPELGQKDLERFGLAVDWRRSFVTTDINPFYDSFIRWQFIRLKERGHIAFGKRPCIFSPIDGQACADHDRSSGEGVKEQEYTLVKIKVTDISANGKLPASTIQAIAGRPVFLVAATLRPETMYGQTNCYLLPDGEYSLVESADGSEVFVTALRAARNMGWQGLVKFEAQEHSMMDARNQPIPEPVTIATHTGAELVGLPLKAPLARHETVYSLPMFTISMEKGTGVVTSVPSDSPDDFAALRDLKQKAALREKYGLTEEMVNYDLVEIIDIPGFGTRAAEILVEQKKIQSQNDKAKLAEAKAEVYLKGFYEGVLTVGAYAGRKVCDVKDLVRKDLIEAGEAAGYYEPEGKVMSRSGAECVVALADQWFLDYGEDAWRGAVENHVKSGNFTAWSTQASNQFEHVLSWLGKWGCSRKFGLGTKLPFDESTVIESLSDSTIYMAYYTIAHMLQGGYENCDGHKVGPSGIKHEELTPEVWDFIFAQSDDIPASAAHHADTLKAFRREFQYWYPMDLRVSGKDLIGNHLTMSLYNHSAIWPGQSEKYWPRGIFTNGHIMVDSEKMSKSLGNFLTVSQCCDEFSADVTRLACADAGDTLDDANFSRTAANAAILRTYGFEELASQLCTVFSHDVNGRTDAEINAIEEVATIGQKLTNVTFRSASSPKTEADLMFENEMKKLITQAETAYAKMVYRDAARYSFYEYQTLKDTYKVLVDGSLHIDSMRKWLETQVIILSPLCPHVTEFIHSERLGKTSALADSQGAWPKEFSASFDALLSRRFTVIMKNVSDFRAAKDKQSGGNRKKASKGQAAVEDVVSFTKAVVYVATEYLPLQQEALSALKRANWNGKFTEVPADLPKQLKADAELSSGKFSGKDLQQIMQFAMFMAKEVPIRGESAFDLTLPFDEVELMNQHSSYIKKALGLDEIEVRRKEDGAHPEDVTPGRIETATPSSPAVWFH